IEMMPQQAAMVGAVIMASTMRKLAGARQASSRSHRRLRQKVRHGANTVLPHTGRPMAGGGKCCVAGLNNPGASVLMSVRAQTNALSGHHSDNREEVMFSLFYEAIEGFTDANLLDEMMLEQAD